MLDLIAFQHFDYIFNGQHNTTKMLKNKYYNNQIPKLHATIFIVLANIVVK